MRKEAPRPRRAKARKNAERTVDRSEADDAGGELPTELALGSDGRIYVNAEGVDPAKLEGRKMFQGFAMTHEEAELAVVEIHKVAFNVTVGVQQALKEKRKTKK
jgi:hypothetical protein